MNMMANFSAEDTSEVRETVSAQWWGEKVDWAVLEAFPEPEQVRRLAKKAIANKELSISRFAKKLGFNRGTFHAFLTKRNLCMNSDRMAELVSALRDYDAELITVRLKDENFPAEQSRRSPIRESYKFRAPKARKHMIQQIGAIDPIYAKDLEQMPTTELIQFYKDLLLYKAELEG